MLLQVRLQAACVVSECLSVRVCECVSKCLLSARPAYARGQSVLYFYPILFYSILFFWCNGRTAPGNERVGKWSRLPASR
ncbi:hypothetical protein AOQ84DRAFT_204286 [Glonium stellatum]|uniref:Uncharacterized protein n=1 Tax=Glonium stellatum TaxID=574774 RepID=A0A8E2ENB7_9PEZI|nr:hypothetical protein AOQ84DRAFT_204286 [Glonium stellatum]